MSIILDNALFDDDSLVSLRDFIATSEWSASCLCSLRRKIAVSSRSLHLIKLIANAVSIDSSEAKELGCKCAESDSHEDKMCTLLKSGPR